MKQAIHLIYLCVLLTLAGCGENKSVRHVPHLGDTPYQQDSVLVAYAVNPERALTLLDSALLLGNVSDYRGQFIRAKIYCKSLMEQRQDSAITICKALLNHDSVRNEPIEKENVLDMLIATSRAKADYEQYLHWATQKAELCQQQNEETERWRTEAEIGLVMTHLRQLDKGLKKLDDAISHLDSPGSIDRMDAFIIAVKRKINALNDLGRFAEVIPLAQRTLDRLDHYEQHAKDYAEDSYRLSWSDHPNDRDRYLDFSRAQANSFMAQAYAMIYRGEGREVRGERIISPLQKAKEHLALFNQSGYSQTFTARRQIAPTQLALGMYDEALATYDEVERRMGADTLNEDYAVILRSRAIAAHAKGRIAEAYDYQSRYAALSKVVSDSLHKSEAHNYAARYHAQEQQLEIQEKEADNERKNIIIGVWVLLFIMAGAVSLYYRRQQQIISEKNRALVRMINGTSPVFTDDEQDEEQDTGEQEPGQETMANVKSSLFNDIDAAIRSERLYANASLQRQDICDRFGIRRHTLNNLLSDHARANSFTQYINAIRMEEAVKLLREQPDLTLTAIAATVGFSPANLRDQFKRQYGMTPGEFRQNI
jgi:AraC-like DNA-binding protein